MPQAAPTQRDLPSGTVSFLFTDIEGSTRLLARLGDLYQVVLEQHHELVRRAVESTDGREVDTQGDAFLVAFARPQDAVATAVAIQRSTIAHEWPEAVELKVRMGIHTGTARLGKEGYVGLDLHRAARIAAVAHGGQIVISSSTRELIEDTLEDDVGLKDLGRHRLKDLDHPQHLHQIVVTGLPDDFPFLRSLDAHPHNLPIQVTSFVGRRADVEAVKKLIHDARLLTLCGPGGTGKTRLALQTVAEIVDLFDDGVFFVPLAPVSDWRLLAPTIALSLTLREQGGRGIEKSLKEYVQDKNLLLLLDNFEHVKRAAPLVSDLLTVAARVKVIITSREALRLSGEQRYLVNPMEVPPARFDPLDGDPDGQETVELFLQRATAVDPSFGLTAANAQDVVEICRRLEGLPLAIELAAARVRVLSPGEILGRLQNRLSLSGGTSDLPTRQQTLRNTIAWSYDLLDDGDRIALQRLAVFRGGWTIDAADAVCNPSYELSTDTLDIMESLLDKSLILRDQRGASRSRFRTLELIREYALEQLRSSGEEQEVRLRHAQVMLELAERSEPQLTGLTQIEHLDQLEIERDNILGAIRWTIGEDSASIGLRIAGALWRFWHLRGHLSEGRRLLDELFALPSAQGRSAERAKALTALGSLSYWQDDHEAARRHYEESLAINREVEDRRGVAEAMYSLAYVQIIGRDFEGARRLYEESRSIFNSLGDHRGIAFCVSGLGLVAERAGDLTAARHFFEDSVEVFNEVNDRFGSLNSRSMLARIDRQMDDPIRAASGFGEVIPEYIRVGNLSGLGWVLLEVASLAATSGEGERAITLAAVADSFRETSGGSAPSALLSLMDPTVGARASLSDEAIAKARKRGRSMSPEEAVSYALEGLAAYRG